MAEGYWASDPTGRMDKRWWDGSAFTVYVTKGGSMIGIDPVGLEAISSHPVTRKPSQLPPGMREFKAPLSTGLASYSVAGTGPSDDVATFLQLFGWIAVLLSCAGGFVLLVASPSGQPGAILPVAIGVALIGSIQGLLLVGFGRLVQASVRSAEFQRQLLVLLSGKSSH